MAEKPLSRRRFLEKGLAASVAAAITPVLAPLRGRDDARDAAPGGVDAAIPPGVVNEEIAPAVHRRVARPVVVASGNGLRAVERAFELVSSGSDPLEAVIGGVNLVEEDPADYTVGYGGIPNAEGVIQLDACCMHGATHRAGGVAALEGIKSPSRVAKLVLEQTDHVLLVGRGALEFAKLHGYREEDLHTPFTRELYRYWKGAVSAKDDYLPPPLESLSPEVQEFIRRYGEEFFYSDAATPEARRRPLPAEIYGTINCNAVDGAGNLAGVTTTSGLFFKIPGRVGDSPILGAGLYLDNDVGAAGSTGRGEANLLNLSSHVVVERMRAGAHPTEACLTACKRIVENNLEKRLQEPDGRPNFGVSFYAVDKAGRYGAASIYEGASFAVADARGARREDAAGLFDRRR